MGCMAATHREVRHDHQHPPLPLFTNDVNFPRSLFRHTHQKIELGKGDTPLSLATNQLTTIYQVPNKEFRNEDEVIQSNGFEVLKQLGQGGFAVVYFARHIKSGIKVACKKMNIGSGSQRSLICDMKNELYVLECVDHPFIVRMFRHFIVNTNLFIFMQLANGGTLSSFIRERGAFSEKESKIPFAQILCGVAYMHKLNIAHRDLKLSNILLLKNDKNEYNVLISDFGLSRIVVSKKNGFVWNRTYCGTEVYMAPEIDGYTRYNAFLVDVWALGVMLFMLINLEYPFDHSCRAKAVKEQKKKNWKFASDIQPPSKELNDMLQRVLNPSPRKRISLRGLTKHEWIVDEYKKVFKLAKRLSHF